MIHRIELFFILLEQKGKNTQSRHHVKNKLWAIKSNLFENVQHAYQINQMRSDRIPILINNSRKKCINTRRNKITCYQVKPDYVWLHNIANQSQMFKLKCIKIDSYILWHVLFRLSIPMHIEYKIDIFFFAEMSATEISLCVTLLLNGDCQAKCYYPQ